MVFFFKNVVINKFIPIFYVLISDRSEQLYDSIFKSIINILTQNNNYNINIITITSDAEPCLINSLNNCFNNLQRINYWNHFKDDIILNSKN